MKGLKRPKEREEGTLGKERELEGSVLQNFFEMMMMMMAKMTAACRYEGCVIDGLLYGNL